MWFGGVAELFGQSGAGLVEVQPARNPVKKPILIKGSAPFYSLIQHSGNSSGFIFS